MEDSFDAGNNIRALVEEATRGDSISQVILSLKLFFGDRMRVNEEKSKKWCIESCKKGNLLAEGFRIFAGWKKSEDLKEDCLLFFSRYISLHESGEGEDIGFAFCLQGFLSSMKIFTCFFSAFRFPCSSKNTCN